MPLLKDILVKQAGVLGNLEVNLPAGAPRVSQLMASVATTLPINPDLPKLPIAPGNGLRVTEVVASLIKGDEEPISSEAKAIEVSSTLRTSSKSQEKEILS